MAELNYQQLKKQSSATVRAFLDVKVAVLAALLVFILYNGAYESIIKSSLEKFTVLDQESNNARQEIEKKKSSLQNLSSLEAQLKGLYIAIPELTQGQSPKVVAASESKRIADLANASTSFKQPLVSLEEPDAVKGDVEAEGKENDAESKPKAGAANFQRELISLSAKGDSVVNIIDLLNQTGVLPNKDNIPPPLNLLKFDYELKLKGSYPALADFLNQLVASKTLVTIQKITLKKPEGPSGQAAAVGGKPKQADAELSESQVPVEMTLLFSIYLYESNTQNAPPPANPPA